jgi:enoyl-CoA hydratase
MAIVDLTVSDRVATITLNDPKQRNAISLPMVEEVIAIVDALDDDPNVGAIVVTGAPPAFCAGANLRGVKGSARSIYEGFLRFARSPLPTLAAVNGPSVGAGMNLALCCDITLAGESARFDSRFLELGMHPGGGHTWMLQRAAGLQPAMAAVLFSEVLDGPEAARVGLAFRCVPDDALLETAQAMASKAASAPRDLAVRAKQTMRQIGSAPDIDQAVDLEIHAQRWSMKQPFFIEGIKRMQQRIGVDADSRDVER